MTEFLIRELKTWRQIETAIAAKALIATDFDVARAAKALRVGPATLYNKIRTEKIRDRSGEFSLLPFDLPSGLSLDDIKRGVFEATLKMTKNRVYRAAELLGVSPTMMYTWTRDR